MGHPNNIALNISPADETEEEMFADDSVYQVMKLFGDFPVVPGKPSVGHVSANYEVSQEDKRISDMLGILENKLNDEKSKEIECLKVELELKQEQITHFEGTLIKLVDFITITHEEIGRLIGRLVLMTIKSVTTARGSSNNILCLGPFKDGLEVNEFVDGLKHLSIQLLDDFEDLRTTRGLMEKINLILKAKVKTSSVLTQGVQRAYDEQTENERTGVNTETPGLSEGGLPPPTSIAPQQHIGRKRGRPYKKGMFMKAEQKKHGKDYSRSYWGHFCLCGAKYSSPSSLSHHVINCTAERKYECKICKTRFVYPSLLKNHMTSSHNVQSWVNDIISCSTCQMNFGTWKEFHKHIYVHASHDNIPKITKRNPSFRNPTNRRENSMGNGLEYHAVDVNSRISNCCTCGKRYSSKSALIVHVNSSRYGKVFECSQCSKRFNVHALLKKHVWMEHGIGYDQQNKFGCYMCGQTFRSSDDLRLHRLSFHHNRNE